MARVWHCGKGVLKVWQGCRKVVARVCQGWSFCTLATFKLSLCCSGLTNSKFSWTNRILVEFQIWIILPHRRASETGRNQNSFIPTFLGHWSPDPSLGSGPWEPDYIGHYEAVAVRNWWYLVSKGHLYLYISNKVEIWTGVTDAFTHSLTTLKDRASQPLIKYVSGALVTQQEVLNMSSNVWWKWNWSNIECQIFFCSFLMGILYLWNALCRFPCQ